jgi:arylformamidase
LFGLRDWFAGAHLVALLATSPSIFSGIVSTLWLGVIALDSAALDVVEIMESRYLRMYDHVFGHDPAYWREVFPSLSTKVVTVHFC